MHSGLVPGHGSGHASQPAGRPANRPTCTSDTFSFSGRGHCVSLHAPQAHDVATGLGIKCNDPELLYLYVKIQSCYTWM